MSTILLIEDTQMLRDYIADCLVYEGHAVLSARNGTEGLELASQHLPDLVMCDVLMPGLDGYTVLERLRSNAATAHIPVIFLTALTSAEDREKGYKLGVNGYLPKPFAYTELIGIIASTLGEQGAAGGRYSLRPA
ncbi:MAG: response regulator [Anaerolineae bacterium]